jgi:Rrf2 family protein
MKISTKGRYGLRAMVDLTISSHGEHVALNSIAQRQNISENYLEQVFASLRKAGLVKSVKGAQGGYVLSRKASDISIGDVLRVLEGNLSVIDSEKIEDTDAGSLQNCIKINLWDKLDEGINKLVDSVTLEDLAIEYNRINGTHSIMYYI